MRFWTTVVPVIGACAVAAVPLVRYGQKQHAEATALAMVRTLQDAQERFRSATGGYALEVESLVAGCPGAEGLPPGVLDELAASGYVVTLRAAESVTASGRDCGGRPIASDYYLAAAPRSGREAATRAYASRSDRRLFAFVDGVPPRESDMANGLAIPVEALESFDIP